MTIIAGILFIQVVLIPRASRRSLEFLTTESGLLACCRRLHCACGPTSVNWSQERLNIYSSCRTPIKVSSCLPKSTRSCVKPCWLAFLALTNNMSPFKYPVQSLILGLAAGRCFHLNLLRNNNWCSIAIYPEEKEPRLIFATWSNATKRCW